MTTVKVGDVVRDPDLLVHGMHMRWADWEDDRIGMLPGPSVLAWDGFRECVRNAGVLILALPDEPKAEERVDNDVGVSWTPLPGCPCSTFEPDESCPHHGRATVIPPRCAPGCTPAQPCHGEVCPGLREPPLEVMGARGVPSDIPAARPSRYVPRCETQLMCGGLTVRR